MTTPDEIEKAVERIFQAAYGPGPSIPTLQEVARKAIIAAEQRGAAAAEVRLKAQSVALAEAADRHRQEFLDRQAIPIEAPDLDARLTAAAQPQAAYASEASTRLRDIAQRARELADHIDNPKPGLPPAFHDFTFLMSVRDFLRSVAEEK